MRPDLCVIGAGSGGLSVAAAAAAFGVEVVLIEKGVMGGDCLNRGCVPSKALIAAANRAQAMRDPMRFGIAGIEPDIQFADVHRHVHASIEALAPNDSEARFSALGVTVIKAHARFSDERTVLAADISIRARRFVLATGSSPAVPPIEGLADVAYLTSDTIFGLTKCPAHLVVIGGGPIGLELAQAHRRLGADVTVIEAGRALSKEDPEAAAVVIAALRAEGIVLHIGARVAKVERRGKAGVRVHVERDGILERIDGSHLLVATGRVADTAGLDLESAGIEFDRTGIKVDDGLRTTNRRVYAIGDATGKQNFTHVAGYHAGLVIRSALFRLPARAQHDIIPRATFTQPELAQIGMTEAQAQDAGLKPSVLRWPYAENDRASVEGETVGHIKIVAGKRGRVHGVTIVGHGAAEMIGFWSLVVSKRLRLSDVAGLVLPYPSMTEIGKRASITYFAGATRSRLVRRAIAFLRMFG